MSDMQAQQVPAGWYPNQQGQMQWWDGYQWTQNYQQQVAQRLEPVDDDARMAILNAEVANLARVGWTVQSVTNGQAVLSRQKRIGWFWNLLLVFLTGGLWLIYVIYRALNRQTLSMIISVDQYGFIQRR